MRGIVLTGLVCLSAIAAGCGGGGGGQAGAIYHSESFSPVKATADNGSAGTLRWVYRINGGAPLSINTQGTRFNAALSDLVLTINPSPLERHAEFSATLSGDVGGSVSAVVSEPLADVAGRTVMTGQDVDADASIRVSGAQQTVNIAESILPSAPIEWFMDRTDLDALAVGYVYRPGRIPGTANVVVSVQGMAPTTLNMPVTYDETWTIVEKLSSMAVAGRTYNNVVVVDRQTVLPDISVTVSTGATPVTMRYWVAKGVGMIRGEGLYRIMGQSVAIELLETNLAPR